MSAHVNLATACAKKLCEIHEMQSHLIMNHWRHASYVDVRGRVTGIAVCAPLARMAASNVDLNTVDLYALPQWPLKKFAFEGTIEGFRFKENVAGICRHVPRVFVCDRPSAQRDVCGGLGEPEGPARTRDFEAARRGQQEGLGCCGL